MRVQFPPPRSFLKHLYTSALMPLLMKALCAKHQTPNIEHQNNSIWSWSNSLDALANRATKQGTELIAENEV